MGNKIDLREILLRYMEYKGWVILNPTRYDFEKLLKGKEDEHKR